MAGGAGIKGGDGLDGPWWDQHVSDPWKPKSSNSGSGVAENPINHDHDEWLDDMQLRDGW